MPIALIDKQLTFAQVAELIGCSVKTVHRLVDSGELRAYRYGKRVIRITREDLMSLLKEVNPKTFAKEHGESSDE